MFTCIFTEVVGDIKRLIIVANVFKVNEAHFLYTHSTAAQIRVLHNFYLLTYHTCAA